MNILLKEQLTEYDITLDGLEDISCTGKQIPYVINYLYARFYAMYNKNNLHYNAIVDSEGCEIIKIEDYGLYLQHLCLNMELPNGYSQAVEVMLDKISSYINNFFTLVSLDNILLECLDELEYKEEFIDKLVNSTSRIATSSDYDELKYEIEQEQGYIYRITKED